MTEKEALVGLTAFVPFGPMRIKLLLEYFGAARKVWKTQREKLLEVGLSEKLVGDFEKHRESFDFSSYFHKLDKFAIKVFTREDKNYPERLKSIGDAPILIYVKGELRPEDDVCIAIVGSRRMTSYGKEMTERLSRELAVNNVTVISGLALGVDAIAHRTALDTGGRTIAVLGSGLDLVYPPSHIGLSKEIEKNGALISEYPLNHPAFPINFPNRNRIISGMSLGVVVVEGTEKSGTLLTASHAASQGREVFAVPGNVTSPTSFAPNILIRQGAKLVINAEDILEELKIELKVQGLRAREVLPETPEEMEILKLLNNEGFDIDSLVRISSMGTNVVLATLTNMELKGMVKKIGGTYIKV